MPPPEPTPVTHACGPRAGQPLEPVEPSTVYGHEGEDPALVAVQHRLVERAKRGEWAAAWRAAASLLAETELPASSRTAHIVTEVAQEFVAELQDRAEEVEAGTRTPWADQPEPSDPTHGRIDRDIQAQVDEMRPTSVGQRVAIENTLQARHDELDLDAIEARAASAHPQQLRAAGERQPASSEGDQDG